jgi:hypothetical protein
MLASTRVRVIGGCALALALGACGGDDGGGFSPTMDNVAGTYHATTFTVENGSGSTNLLQLGASVDVILAANGTTSGQLFVPGAGDNGGTLDENLAGTWSLSGSTVTFNQTANTLIEGAEFTAEQNQLTGNGTINGLTILLVLTRTG